MFFFAMDFLNPRNAFKPFVILAAFVTSIVVLCGIQRKKGQNKALTSFQKKNDLALISC